MKMAGTDENVYEVDASVGTIVWVRRRNGSWWPGRILGEEELSASHLMSPRSGTPVKLLGRDDASVDWYNLEKSKRVKPFRCGEFDDSIEKAERAQGAAIKKREKYARREDAILHALELEREQYEMKQQKLGITKRTRRRVPSAVKRALSGHSKLVHSKAQSLLKVRASSYEEESMDNPLYVQKAKHGKQRQEDASSEAVPRMRGLQDFGLRTAPSKRKLSPSEGSENHFSEYNHVPDLPSGSPVMEGVNPANPLALKRKAQGGLLEESLAKRRDRRRPLVQVLQSTAMLPTPDSLQPDADASLSVRREQEHSGSICRAKRSQCVYLPSDSNDHLDHTEVSSDQMQLSPSEDYQPSSGSSTDESTSSETLDEVESDSSEGGSVNSETDGEMDVLSDFTQPPTVAEPRTSENVYMANGRVQGQTESMSSEDIDESAVNDYMPRPRLHDQIASSTADVGVSKWQLKGKRNTRNLLKRPVQIGGKISNGSIYGAYLEDKENGLKNSIGQRRYPGSSALNYEYDEDVFIEKSPMQSQMPGFGNRRYPPPFKGRSNPDIIDSEEDPIWEAERRPQAALRGYWDESAGYDPNPMYVNNHRYGRGKKTMLIDVDVKARATYQGEHVPLVSLMSRLNGKAIIGHPIQIEPLEDGSTDGLVSGNYDFIAEPIDGSTTLKPVWRTGRRTAMQRVPRPHRFTALNEDEDGDPSEDFDLEGYQKSHGRHQYPKTRKASYSKKPMKKASLSSQKTRMLSSISIDQRHGGKAGTQRLVNKFSSFENGPTTVTCIPVKLVFSRLMEAVGRPPSRPPKQIITSTNGDTERKSA